MHGEHGKAWGPSTTLVLAHGLILCLAFWVLVGEGGRLLWEWVGEGTDPGVGLRSHLLVLLSTVYLIRFALGTFALLPRRIGWSEVAAVSVWLGIIHLTFACAGRLNPEPVGVGAVLGIALYLGGSFLSTASEIQRKVWKGRPENKGRLFTGGFFRYTMHPNYLGDVLLFLGFGMATGRWIALAIPLLTAATFVFVHIPALDAYLAGRYGKAFTDYRERTKRLMPGVW